MAPELSAPRAVRVFREAQSRANNVAHDLDDLEWIDQTDEMVHAGLIEVQREAYQLITQLRALTGFTLLQADPDAVSDPVFASADDPSLAQILSAARGAYMRANPLGPLDDQALVDWLSSLAASHKRE